MAASKQLTFDWNVNLVNYEDGTYKPVITKFRIIDPEVVLEFINNVLYDGVSDDGSYALPKKYKLADSSELNHVWKKYIKQDVIDFLKERWIANEDLSFEEFVELLLKQDWVCIDFFKQYRNECMRATFPNARPPQD